MRTRTALKVLKKWSMGLGHYTDNHFGTVFTAYRKMVSYHLRRGRRPEQVLLNLRLHFRFKRQIVIRSLAGLRPPGVEPETLYAHTDSL